MTERRDLAGLVADRHVVVCCGTGGVGKTTTAAALAIAGARAGRDTVVVTIDPAKRLANTLGIDELADAAHEIPRARWDPHGDAPATGRLHALMLDTKNTFDELVTRYALTEDQAEQILDNRFYRNIAGALSGTQEYMAMEKLYELHDTGGFDLIVVDTPPTRHALDFLDAPRRLTRLLDNRVFRWLMVPTRSVVRVGSVAAQALLRTIARVVGREPVDDVVAFFHAFEGMEQGFRDRAQQVLALLTSEQTAFVLVTSPRRDAVEEAAYFADRLAEDSLSVDAVVVNRVHPHFGTRAPSALRDRAAAAAARSTAPGDAGARLAAAYENLAEFEEVAGRERREVGVLEQRIGDAAVVYVPELGRDVFDFDALHAVGEHLTAAG